MIGVKAQGGYVVFLNEIDGVGDYLMAFEPESARQIADAIIEAISEAEGQEKDPEFANDWDSRIVSH